MIGGSSDALTGLSSAERARLAHFAAAFERLDASQYVTLADVRPSQAVQLAESHANEAIGSGPRRDAVVAAVRAFADDAAAAYSRRFSLPDQPLIYGSLPDRAEDRVGVLRSLERAVVAIILDDQLDAADRAALLGSWAVLDGAPPEATRG